MNIYPSILVDSYEEFERRIRLVEDEASFFHIDVADGKFVPRISFHDREKISEILGGKDFELHLMLQNPDVSALPWLKTPAKRIIFHWEAKEGPHTWVWGLIRKIKKAGKEAGIALNPKTSQEKIYAFLNGIDSILIMSVEPGFSGQKFMPEVLPKIKALRDKNLPFGQNLSAHPFRSKKFCGIIEVDGGMNEETILLAKEAGADAVAIAGAIFGREEPREALLKLKAQNAKRKTTTQS